MSFVRRPLPSVRAIGALVAGLALGATLHAGIAAAQCTYPTLTDDVPQTFTTTPQYLRFTQAAGRWAAVAVQSAAATNWDIGFSLSTGAFPTCLSLPVVASQQTSGIDFVLGDFAAEGTGTRYAPISRVSGTGSALVEWDSGARTAIVGPGYNGGQNPPGLIDCWNVDLVAGMSYKFRFRSEGADDYRLYAFRRGATNSWRKKADALVEIGSNLSFAPPLTATTTDRYAIVVVRQTATTVPYVFSIQPCVDPPHLEPHVSLPIPALPGLPETAFQFEPAGGGFPTVAARVAQDGDWYYLQVLQHVNPGSYPCEGVFQAGSEVSGQRVELMVGDQVSGAVPAGGSWWLGALGSTNLTGRAEFSPGTDVVAVDGATRYVVGGNDLVVRTFRCDLVAGNDVRIHVAKCGPATGRLLVFRPFDATVPTGNGWSSPSGPHPPVATVTVTGVNDFNFTPPVTGAYALVLTNDTGENNCWELGVSTCRRRLELQDGVSQGIYVNPILASDGEVYGALHGRFGWSAVAVRPNAVTEDWVVEAWDAPTGGDVAPYSGCLWGLLGASTDPGISSRVDFLARYDLPVPELKEWIETVHVYPAGHASAGGGAGVEFEMYNTTLAIGDLVNGFPTNPFDLIEVWNVELVAGQPYAVHFQPVGFNGELFVMKSLLAPTSTCSFDCPPEYLPLGGAGQVLRTSAPTTFVPDQSGVYGLIVVNQNGGTGHFSLAVNQTTLDASPGGGTDTPFVTRIRAVAPNPLAAGARLDFELARPGRVGFDFVDLAGRIVARIPPAPYEAGPGSVAWSARAADGRALRPGLYFARMKVDGITAARAVKLVVR